MHDGLDPSLYQDADRARNRPPAPSAPRIDPDAIVAAAQKRMTELLSEAAEILERSGAQPHPLLLSKQLHRDRWKWVTVGSGWILDFVALGRDGRAYKWAGSAGTYVGFPPGPNDGIKCGYEHVIKSIRGPLTNTDVFTASVDGEPQICADYYDQRWMPLAEWLNDTLRKRLA